MKNTSTTKKKAARSTAATKKTSAPKAPKKKPAAQRPVTTDSDWQSETLARVRALIAKALPKATEDVKWRKPSNGMRGVPVWSQDGIVCTGETYKNAVKLTFAHGAALDDPSGLFNAGLAGGTRRAIDLHQGDTLNERAFTALVRAAAAFNAERKPAPTKPKTSKTAAPRLLSGDNPQIPKGDGDAPVQAYIAAIPGWKQSVARRVDAIITRTVPNVRKAIKWNSPFYGAGDSNNGWFASLHCFTNYVKVAFFAGTSLNPPPPGESKQKTVRYLDIRENGADGQLDEPQLANWINQAARLPGEHL